ncbi:related to GYP5 - GTPase-activating protein (GAP) [Melanopsichium pennsylvanicum]|uniref:GTPase-activating protein GYP5 n=2 Tax=Melanopsichium pennsylvanicum TaxID=63383 RepID=A0AAJ5C6L7_9BASI|nr:related to GYP5-GTPase-activating protein (GAP) [Melanopsichium pennsylvanicum 4]SNX85982.1 related to GYP5 - GTPase-activating protein (GAP) [Melanopsichium pennsylvanicum]
MARKGANKAAASANRISQSAEEQSEQEPQPSLADELSTDNQKANEGYESSTHTDNDDFEDAADGADEITPSSSANAADDVVVKAQAKVVNESLNKTADEGLARKPSTDVQQAQTPKAADTSFPEMLGSQFPMTNQPVGESNGIAASPSTVTFTSVGQEEAETVETPLSSAEIRDSQIASSSLILDEDTAKLNLNDPVEKVPPSVGATSMLEPDETICNPFSEDPIKYTPSLPSSIPPSIPPSDVASTNPPDTPGMNSNHFSVVSLGSASPNLAEGESDWSKRDSRRDTITTNGGARSSVAERSNDSQIARNGGASSNYDFLLARVKTQQKRLSGDPKQMRASIDGAVKLREHFEKLRDGRRHSRTDSQNRSIDGSGASSSNDSQPSKAPATFTATNGASAHRESTASSASTAWKGPPTEDVLEEEIDWEFWGEVMSNYQSVARNHPRQLSRAIQAGIPPALRGMMWQLMSSSKNEEMEIIYAYLLKQTSTHEKAIRRDLNRTFPEQDYFQDGKGIGQENLFNVIKAYSLYDPEVGYCQGMQFVVGPLLLNMPDEEAFSTFVRLMKSYDLRGHFTPNMPALQLRLFQFDRLLEDFLPLLHKHLVRQGVKSSMYASQWFMTLFSYRFPLDFVYRVLDSVFAEGVEALFRFAIALMKKNEERLLEMNFEQAVNYLKMELFESYRRSDASNGAFNAQNDAEASDRTAETQPSGEVRSSLQSATSCSSANAEKAKPQYRTNEFVRDAFEIKITPFILDTYASEFDSQVRAANAHRREVEALRLVNRNLASRVKALEEQLNSVNAEHVEMVKDVVMAKIAKEEMAEELVKYKMMYAEAVLAADQESVGHRGSAAGMAAAAQRRQAERDSGGSTSGGFST